MRPSAALIPRLMLGGHSTRGQSTFRPYLRFNAFYRWFYIGDTVQGMQSAGAAQSAAFSVVDGLHPVDRREGEGQVEHDLGERRGARADKDRRPEGRQHKHVHEPRPSWPTSRARAEHKASVAAVSPRAPTAPIRRLLTSSTPRSVLLPACAVSGGRSPRACGAASSALDSQNGGRLPLDGVHYWNRPCSSRALPRGRFRRWWRPFFRSQSPCREPVAKKRSGHSVRVKRTWTRRRNWRRRRRRRRRHGCSRSGGPPRRPPDDTCQIPSDWRVAHVASRGRLDARHPATTLRHAPPAGRSHSHSHRTAHALQYGIVAQTTLSFRVSGAATSDPKWRRRHLDP